MGKMTIFLNPYSRRSISVEEAKREGREAAARIISAVYGNRNRRPAIRAALSQGGEE